MLIRTAWSDQHGIVRSKSLLPQAFFNALSNGMQISTGTFLFDTGGTRVFNPFVSGGSLDMEEMTGAPNLVAVPDPNTFRILPWAKRTCVILCDLYFQNGLAMPLSSRGILRQSFAELHQRGLEHIVGLEVEWYLAKLEDPMLDITHVGTPGNPGESPKVSAVEHSFQYLLESHNLWIHDLLQILAENFVAMGLPLRIEPLLALKRRGFWLEAKPSFSSLMTIWLSLSSYGSNRSTGETSAAGGFPDLGNWRSRWGNQGTGFRTRLLHLRITSSLSCRPRERLRPTMHENFPDFLSKQSYPSTFSRGGWTNTMWRKHLLPSSNGVYVSPKPLIEIYHMTVIKIALRAFPPRTKVTGLPRSRVF